ncbi:MAG: hypothetical protein WCI77_00880 [Candidatus Omnitrophota bacterium]
MRTLLKYRKNYYSQNGEDGVIREILKRLDIKDSWFVDVGAWDGRYLSNTFLLLQKGWKGVDIEADNTSYNDLLKTANKFPARLFAIFAKVTVEGDDCLDSLLSRTQIPKEFGLLNIDIDSYDWWVWKTLNNYYPKIVIIEINSSFSPGIKHVQPANVVGLETTIFGASFTSTLSLGEEKGYRLVCHTGNMIFVRKDIVGRINLPAEELNFPHSLFITNWLVNKKESKIIFIIKLPMRKIMRLLRRKFPNIDKNLRELKRIIVRHY